MTQNANEIAELQDRRDIPVFIHRELDDLGLSAVAFRLYCHLARRAGSGMAWPSYQSMGDHCYMGQAEAGRRRNIAIEAMKELVERGLIKKVIRKDGDVNETNLYYLTPRDEWGGSTPGVLGGVVRGAYQGSTPGVPKGTPFKSSDPNKEEGAAPEKPEPKFKPTDDEWAAVFKCWHDNMPGMLTPILTDEITDWGGEYGAAAVIKAITAAVTAGVRKPNYVNAILVREASGDDRKPKESKQYQNGGGRAGNKDADPDTQRANAMYGERKRVVVTMPDLPDDPGF